MQLGSGIYAEYESISLARSLDAVEAFSLCSVLRLPGLKDKALESIREMWFDHDGIHLSEPLLQFRGVLTGVPVERRTDSPGEPYIPDNHDQ